MLYTQTGSIPAYPGTVFVVIQPLYTPLIRMLAHGYTASQSLSAVCGRDMQPLHLKVGVRFRVMGRTDLYLMSEDF